MHVRYEYKSRVLHAHMLSIVACRPRAAALLVILHILWASITYLLRAPTMVSPILGHHSDRFLSYHVFDSGGSPHDQSFGFLASLGDHDGGAVSLLWCPQRDRGPRRGLGRDLVAS